MTKTSKTLEREKKGDKVVQKQNSDEGEASVL